MHDLDNTETPSSVDCEELIIELSMLEKFVHGWKVHMVQDIPTTFRAATLEMQLMFPKQYF